jgi:hypothetical protein
VDNELKAIEELADGIILMASADFLQTIIDYTHKISHRLDEALSTPKGGDTAA